MACHRNTSQDAAQGQSDDAERALCESDLGGGHAESSLFHRVEQEGDAHLGQLGFRQTIEQHEQDGSEGLFFLEEGAEGEQEVGQNTFGIFRMRGRRTVLVGSWQDERMVEPQGQQTACQREEGDAPGVRGTAGHFLQPSGQHDEQPLSGNGGKAVEGAADAHEEGLLVRRKPQHIESVGGDVVGGGAEGHQPEHGQGGLEEMARRDGEGNAGQSRSQQQLGDDNPPPFGAEQVDKRAPQGLDDPGQVQPAGVEGYLRVRDAHPLVHHQRENHDRYVGQAFGEVERRYPIPRRTCVHGRQDLV